MKDPLDIAIDAIGLVVVTIIGCDIARQMGHPPVIAVLAGVITGCGGGIIRGDVLCNQVPLLFSSEIYAGASIVTGATYVSGLALGLNVEATALVAIGVGLALRLLAVWRKMGLAGFANTRQLALIACARTRGPLRQPPVQARSRPIVNKQCLGSGASCVGSAGR